MQAFLAGVGAGFTNHSVEGTKYFVKPAPAEATNATGYDIKYLHRRGEMDEWGWDELE